MSSRFGLLKALLLVAILVGSFVIFSQDAQAVSRLPYNSFETEALDLCKNTGSTTLSSRGALWFSNGANYYDDEVVAVGDASYVDISLRGSMVRCAKGGSRVIVSDNVYATQIEVIGSQAWRFSNFDQSTANCEGRAGYAPCMYRGSFSYKVIPAGTSDWTTTGNAMSVTMNISGLAMDASRGFSDEITVSLMRCPGTVDGWPIKTPGESRCYDTEQTIKIRRVPPPSFWTIRGESYVKKNTIDNSARRQGVNAETATPGNTIYWDHDLRNNSRFSMDRDVTVNIDHATVGIGVNPTGDTHPGYGPDGWTGRGGPDQLFYVRNNLRIYNQSGRIVTQDDVGNKICQRVAWNNKSHNEAWWGWSNWSCVNVPYNYLLTPTISLTADAVSDGTSVISGISAGINNSGPTKSNPSNYSVVRFVVKGDETTNITGGSGVIVPASGATPSGVVDGWQCEVVRQIGVRSGAPINYSDCLGGGLPSSSSSVVIGTGGRNIVVGDNDISGLDLTVGDRLCYTMMVSAYDQSVGRNVFRYATPVCLRVAKKPKVQFWGGDVRTDELVRTSLSRRESTYFGSWAEYAIFAGETSSVATSSSGAGLSSSNHGRSIGGGATTYNSLTFGNSPEFGGYGAARSTIPAAFLGSGSNITSSSIDAGSLSTGLHTRGGNLTIGSSTIGPGKRVYIRATGTVIIDGNLLFDSGAHSDLSSLPQLVILAQNIVINADVTEVNAWLIAMEGGYPNPASQGGYISTCGTVANPSSYTSGLTNTVCDKPLVINGPVLANHLYLRRTFGAEKEHPGIPAEVLNLRPDTYLSFYDAFRNSGSIKTMYLRDKPPRF